MNSFFKTFAGLVTGSGAAAVAGIAVSLLGMTAFDFQWTLIFGASLGTSLTVLNLIEEQDTFTNTFLGAGMGVVAYVALSSLATMTVLGSFGAAIIGAFVGWLVLAAESFNSK